MLCDMDKKLVAYPLLEGFELTNGHRISTTEDGDNIDARRQPLHKNNIHFPQPTREHERVNIILRS